MREAFGSISRKKRAVSNNRGIIRRLEPRANSMLYLSARTAMAILLVIAVSFMLSGCRNTDVLTQKIVDPPGVSEIDYSLNPVRSDNPESSDEDVANRYEGDSRDQGGETQEDTPDYNPEEQNSQQETSKHVYDSTVLQANGQASDGGSPNGEAGDASDPNATATDDGRADKEGEDDRAGDGGSSNDPLESPRGEAITIEDSSSEGEPQPEDAPELEDELSADDGSTWSPRQGESGGGTGENKQGSIYADGTYDTIPSVGKVAAAGPYATIVQSLGGRGALAAAPQQWLDGLPAAAYNGGEELADVRGISAWGDGTQMTDAAVRDIIDSGAECVLTSNTFNVMSQDQANAFSAAGVDVLVLPDIGVYNAMDEDILTTADVIGELLKDAGLSIQFDAKRAAATYRSMHNEALATYVNKNGGYSCLMWGNYYLQNWIYQGNWYEAEANKIRNVSENRVFTTYIDYWDEEKKIGLGNPRNNVDSRSSYDLISFYFQHSGAVRRDDNAGESDFGIIYSNTTAGIRLAPAGLPEIADRPYVNPNGLSTPLFIARNGEIASKVAQSVADSEVMTWSDEDKFRSGYNLGYDYDVFVMPSGIDGSWNDGSFESFLLVPWTYSIINNHGTADSDSFVNDFYSTFYRSGPAGLIEGYGQTVHVSCTG